MVHAATAVTANVAAAREGPSGAIAAIMALSAFNSLEAAFAVAKGNFLDRGDVVVGRHAARTQMSLNEERHRKTMILFVPCCEPMRADPRFIPMCRSMGIEGYWRKSRRWPDFLLS